MAALKSAKPSASRQVDTHCNLVEDLGLKDYGFGAKPMLKFTFESDEVNEYGSKHRYTRLFHKHNHPESALSIAIKSWTGRDLAAEADDIDDINFKSFEKMPARLTLELGCVRDGKRYENVIDITGIKATGPKQECEPDADCEPEITEAQDNE